MCPSRPAGHTTVFPRSESAFAKRIDDLPRPTLDEEIRPGGPRAAGGHWAASSRATSFSKKNSCFRNDTSYSCPGYGGIS